MGPNNIGGAQNRGIHPSTSSAVVGSVSANQQASSKDVNSGNSHVSLNVENPATALKITNQELQKALKPVQAPQSPAKIHASDSDRPSPGEVAGKALTAIQQGLASVNKNEGEDFLNEAAAGLKEGFSQARATLSNLIARTKEAKQEVDDTEQLVNRGVENIRKELATDKAANGTPAEKLVS